MVRKDGRTDIPTTRAGRNRRAEEHQARRAAHREKLWSKVDLILDMIEVPCPDGCRRKHEHSKGTSARDMKDLAVAYGVLLDKYRLETGSGQAGGSDIDDYLLWLGSESKPPRSRDVKKAEKVVDAKVH